MPLLPRRRSFPAAHLSLASLVFACLLSPACKPRLTPVELALTTQTLHLGNGAEPSHLDPHLVSAFTDYNILLALFEGLTAIDEASALPIPAAASHWETSPDGLRYTFHLRPEARWSDGSPLTAADFLFSFQRCLSPALGSEYAYLLYPLLNAEAFHTGQLSDFSSVGARALDPLTLELTLAYPVPYLPALLAHNVWFPVHPPSVLADGPADARITRWTRPGRLIGNGPYLLTEWTPNQRIVATRHPHHWDDPSRGIQTVVFYPTDHLPADEAAFRTGRLHATYDLLPDRLPHYQATAPHLLRIDPLLETWFLRFNTTRPPFDDPRVRRALSLALDRDAITGPLLHHSRLPARHYAPPGIGGYEGLPLFQDDPAEARRLLAQAGFPDGRGFPRFELQANTDSLNTLVLQAIQAMWQRELGLEVTLVHHDFRVYLQHQIHLNYTVSRSRWIGDYNDPATYLDMFITGGGQNQTGWSHPDYDRLIALAARLTDPTARFAAFRQAEALLIEQAPLAPVFFGAKTHLLHPHVQGWTPSLLGSRRYQTLHLADSP